MIKRTIRLVYLLSALFPLTGQAQVPELFAYRNDSKSLLWEVSGNGLQKPSYFFGTMHLMCTADINITPSLKQVIKTVEQIYFEMDLNNIDEMRSTLMNIQPRTDSTLKNTLTADEYKRVEDFFSRNGLGMVMNAMQNLPPMFLASLVNKILLPCNEEAGMELAIIEEAALLKKKTYGLETLAFQMKIIEDLPYTQQTKDLLQMIDSSETYKKEIPELIALYKRQDIDSLIKITGNNIGTTDMEEKLLTKRNVNWVQQFTTIAGQNPTLFAVGAGHLGGIKGVLQLLRERGYTVRAIVNEQ